MAQYLIFDLNEKNLLKNKITLKRFREETQMWTMSVSMTNDYRTSSALDKVWNVKCVKSL